MLIPDEVRGQTQAFRLVLRAGARGTWRSGGSFALSRSVSAIPVYIWCILDVAGRPPTIWPAAGRLVAFCWNDCAGEMPLSLYDSQAGQSSSKFLAAKHASFGWRKPPSHRSTRAGRANHPFGAISEGEDAFTSRGHSQAEDDHTAAVVSFLT